MDIRNYNIEIYKTADKAIQGDKASTDWLLENGYPEWAAFANGIQGDNDATLWLLKNGFPEMGVLVNGFNDEPNALVWLNQYPDPFYYAFCQATKKEEKALQFLEANHHIPFLILAETIRKTMRLRIKKETFWYRIKW